MSDLRQQTWIEAPVEIVWDLVADVNRHPDWWPRVIEVECEGLEEGCTYREVVQDPLGQEEEMQMRVEGLEDCKELMIRCVNTGTFFHLRLTQAQDGTFVDGRFGMEPRHLQHRVFDLVAGKRYFRRWLEKSLDAMNRAAAERSKSVDAA
jgi:Polyketide cyclase / dehydrase and lipid transport